MERELKEHGIKITPQRLELIKKLKELEKIHPSFNEVYNAIIKTYPNVSRSTVYENLKLLVELDVIKSFHYNGEIHYEMNFEPHVNMVEPSGKIIDIKNDKVRKLLEEIESIIEKDEGIELKNLLVIIEKK